MTLQTTQSLERRAAVTKDPVARLERMVEIRSLEDRMRELFAEGLVHGTTHTCHGQEAVSVGIAAAVRPTDQVTCTYRGHGMALALGMTLETVGGELLGRTTGCVGGRGGSMHLCDPDVGLLPTFAIVGAGIPVAVGAALTADVLGKADIAVAVFGDGASNIGAFHEGLNLAAIWNLPVVFVCENNVYGEYSRINLTTPIEDIAVRATSYGIPGEKVDGQDVDAVSAAVGEAASRARDGGGPTLLEMKTYRFAGHSRADTAPYRPAGELEEWQQRDPIDLYRAQLVSSGVIDADAATKLEQQTRENVIASLASSLEEPAPSIESMFQNVWVP
jgi:TPP-dependent pyruvate/acetoin dehydrogenase alpha subunit